MVWRGKGTVLGPSVLTVAAIMMPDDVICSEPAEVSISRMRLDPCACNAKVRYDVVKQKGAWFVVSGREIFDELGREGLGRGECAGWDRDGIRA